MSQHADQSGAPTPDEDDDPATILRALGSALAHDLRTPLTTIYAGAELVAGDRLSGERRAEAAQAMAREAARLSDVVEDLVVLVRGSVDATLEPELLLIQHILAAAVASPRSSGSAAAIELRVEPDLPPILGSEPEVVHAIRNVIGHATLNSPSSGRIDVLARRVDAAIEVVVRDDGPGRDADEAASAFQLFGRSARDRGDPSGANLALVVARRLVERMGGSTRALASSHGETVLSFPVQA